MEERAEKETFFKRVFVSVHVSSAGHSPFFFFFFLAVDDIIVTRKSWDVSLWREHVLVHGVSTQPCVNQSFCFLRRSKTVEGKTDGLDAI